MFGEVEIREAREGDVKGILCLLRDGGGTEYMLPSGNYSSDFIALKGKKIIGFVLLVRRPESEKPYTGYWLHGLFVGFRYRGFGVGEALTMKVISRAKEEKASELFLSVKENKIGAISLYSKLGFKRKIVPQIEELLEQEKIQFGRRSILMSKEIC